MNDSSEKGPALRRKIKETLEGLKEVDELGKHLNRKFDQVLNTGGHYSWGRLTWDNNWKFFNPFYGGSNRFLYLIFQQSIQKLIEKTEVYEEMYKGFDSRNQWPNLLVGVKEKTNLLEHRFAQLI